MALKARLRTISFFALISAFVCWSGLGLSLEVRDVQASNALMSLGERLFASRLLSRTETVSCQSCHVPQLGFSGDRPYAVGVGGYVGARRAPPLIGLASATAFMWDGRAKTLRDQVVLPLEGTEMEIKWTEALPKLEADPVIAGALKHVTMGAPTRELIISALVEYVSMIPSAPSRFDRYIVSQDASALSEQEIWGLRLFVRKGRCSSCHLVNGRDAPLSDGTFHVIGAGIGEGRVDRGRALVTGVSTDEGAFKTPSLRGVALRPFLMHDGSITSLRDAVEHYNRGGGSGLFQLDPRLRPLFLSRDEVNAIVAFLRTLTPEALLPDEARKP